MNNKHKFRHRVRRLTQFFGLVLILVFTYIIVKGAFWTPPSHPSSNIPLNSTELKHFNSKQYWLTHLSPELIEKLNSLDNWVVGKRQCSNLSITAATKQSAEHNPASYCAFLAQTKVDGVLKIYLSERPNTLSSNTPWFGGFVDPTDSTTYDLLGRVYKTNP